MLRHFRKFCAIFNIARVTARRLLALTLGQRRRVAPFSKNAVAKEQFLIKQLRPLRDSCGGAVYGTLEVIRIARTAFSPRLDAVDPCSACPKYARLHSSRTCFLQIRRRSRAASPLLRGAACKGNRSVAGGTHADARRA